MDQVIDTIEDKISLLEPFIEFEEIIDSYLREIYSEEEIEEIDVLEFRKRQVESLQNRFKDVYDFNILSAENGFSILNVQDDDDQNIRKYLHKFLSHKSLTGGAGANADGSAELFERISANAVKNFMGKGAKSIMVGEGRKNLKKKRLKKIAKKIKEKTGVYHNLPKKAKDDGVDFIVYKPIDKRKVGNLIILGQACVGIHFNEKKAIRQRWQNEYIPYAIRPPTTLLSVVYFLEPEILRKVHSEFENSIVFDRGRIMKYYDPSDINLNSCIIDFVNAINDE